MDKMFTNKYIEQTEHDLKKMAELLSEQRDLGVSIDNELENYCSPNFDIQSRLEKNITAFSNFYPDIARSFNNYKPTRFKLLVQDDIINIYDTIEQNFVYSERDGIYQSFKAAQVYRTRPVNNHLTFSQEDAWERDKMISVDLTNEAANYIKHRELEYNKYKLPRYLPSYINNFNLFGIGFGKSLETLVKHHEFYHLHIIEPHPDIFFVSLLFADWEMILEKLDESGTAMHISIGDNIASELTTSIIKDLQKFGPYHASYSYFYSDYKDEALQEMRKHYSKNFLDSILAIGYFDDSRRNIGHSLANFCQGSNFLISDSPECAYQQTPVFIVANGPSLDKTIDAIKSNRSKALIVSLGTSLKALISYDVVPDIHIEQERGIETYKILSQNISKDILKQLMLMGTSHIHPKAVSLFDKAVLGLKANEASVSLINKGDELAELLDCNPTVTNCALSMFLHMGFNNLYLFGADLGFPDDKHHSQKSMYFDENGQDNNTYKYNKVGLSTEYEGNFGGTVSTDYIFDLSKRTVDSIVRRYPNASIKNTSYGVKLEGCVPQRADTLHFENDIDQSAVINFIVEKSSTPATSDLHDIQGSFVDGEKHSEFLLELRSELDQRFNSRKELIAQLEKTLRTIVSTLKDKDTEVMFHLIYGTYIKISNMIITGLMYPQSEKYGLDTANHIIGLFCDFLTCGAYRHKMQPVFTEDSVDEMSSKAILKATAKNNVV